MHRRAYDQLLYKPKLDRKIVNLQSANGTCLKVDGCVSVSLSIGGTEMSQDFYVVSDLETLFWDWIGYIRIK